MRLAIASSMNTPNVKLVDTSIKGMFDYGMRLAIACWKSGCTVESITHGYQSGTAKDRGVIAACELILGWQDVAEREARYHGYSREEATQLVRRMLEGL